MSLTAIANLVVGVCHVADLAEKIEKEKRNPNLGDGCSSFSILARVTQTGLNVFASLEEATEGSSERLRDLRGKEAGVAFVNGLLKFGEAVHEQFNTPSGQRSAFKFFEKGIVAPFADTARALAQYHKLREENYILQVERDGSGERRVFAGYDDDENIIYKMKPIDVEECRQNIREYNETILHASMARAAAEAGLVSGAGLIGTELYLLLAQCMQFQGIELSRETFDLLSLNRIPESFYGDVVFNKYRCGITGAPIRHVVCDPDKETLYERAVIEEYLTRNSTSPATGNPLRIHELLIKPNIQTEINTRLRFHQNNFWSYVDKSPELQSALVTAPPSAEPVPVES